MKNTLDIVKCTDAVIKIASRCNINCTYCYMYNHDDDTFKLQPKFMSDETLSELLKKIKIHCLIHGLDEFQLIMHGGEPLLAGIPFFENFITKSKNYLLPEVEPKFSTQTNGMLINEEWCDIIKKHNISVGVSLDGVKKVNDQYRLDHKGNGTYDRVIEGIEILQKAEIDIGVLSVINLEANPIVAYEHYKEIKIDNVDFLFPDYTFDNLPPGIYDPTYMREETPYADWLIKIFDVWFLDKEKLDVRFFKYSVCLLLGGDIDFDYLGTTNNDILVIETDGGIEPVDSLKICGHGFTKMKANVSTNTFSEALDSPLSRMYHLSKKQIAKQCTVCPLKDVCGGGFLPHRFSKKNGFNNPSLYCADLIKLFTHFHNAVIGQFTEQQRKDLGGVGHLEVSDIKKEINDALIEAPEPEYIDKLEFFKS